MSNPKPNQNEKQKLGIEHLRQVMLVILLTYQTLHRKGFFGKFKGFLAIRLYIKEIKTAFINADKAKAELMDLDDNELSYLLGVIHDKLPKIKVRIDREGIKLTVLALNAVMVVVDYFKPKKTKR